MAHSRAEPRRNLVAGLAEGVPFTVVTGTTIPSPWAQHCTAPSPTRPRSSLSTLIFLAIRCARRTGSVINSQARQGGAGRFAVIGDKTPAAYAAMLNAQQPPTRWRESRYSP